MKDSFEHRKIKNSGFKLPEGYFDTFDEELEAKIRVHNLPKKTGFNAPEGYFDEFEVQLNQSKSRGRLIAFNFSNLKYGVAAAMVLGLLSTFFWFSPSSNSYDKLYSNLSQEDINSWFDQNDIEISSSDMVAVYSDDLSDTSDLIETNFNENNIESYLQESSETEIVIDEFY